jgi:ribosomal protein L37E
MWEAALPKIIDTRPDGEATCPSCGFVQKIKIDKHEIGDMMQPYPGGGMYGRCRKCGRTGMKVTSAPTAEPKKPVGWSDK